VTAWPEFGQPAWLLLLPALLPLLLWWWHAASGRFAALCQHGLRRRPSTAVAARSPAGRHRGPRLALAGAGVALAGRRCPIPSRAPTAGIAILLIVDVSNSMNDGDFLWNGQPPRGWRRSRRASAFTSLRRRRPPAATHLPAQERPCSAFPRSLAQSPRVPCPLTLSHDALLQILDARKAGNCGHDVETNIGAAIAGRAPLNTSRSAEMCRAGDRTATGRYPDALKPRQAAQLAAALRVRFRGGPPATTPSRRAAPPSLAAESRRQRQEVRCRKSPG